MNLDQAYQILDYGAVPQSREEQIKLIQIMGYTHLRGGSLLPKCYDQQLLRVAERLFKEAERKAHAQLHAELQELSEEEEQIRYHAFLCDSFNLPKEQRSSVTISELEEQLQQ